MADMNDVYRSALAGISTDGKIEHLKVTLKAINAKKYISFLTKLRKKLGNEPIYIFIDNLRVHKTVAVMKEYTNLKMTPVFNETYSPNYMPIETIFSQVKRRAKEARLNKLANGKIVDMDVLIRQAFSTIKSESILRAIKASTTLLIAG